MAVPGRKISQCRGSISPGSEEDLDHNCEPCSTEDLHIEAFRYCLECQEYLCKNCVKFHLKTKLLKHHNLVDKDDKVKETLLTNSSADVFTVKCTVHRNDVIIFFCPIHDALGCSNCMVMDHRVCSIEYIPDICENIGDSDEFRQTMNSVNEKLKDVDTLRQKAKSKDTDIDASHDEAINEIVKFRKQINDRLDFLQEQTVAKAVETKSTGKQRIKAVLDTCNNITFDMNQQRSRLKESKSVDQKVPMFIAMKQAQLKLRSDKMKEPETSFEKADFQYKFERNKDVERILSYQDLGKLTDIVSMPTDLPAVPETEENDKLDIGKSSNTQNISVKEKIIHTSDKGQVNLTRKTDTNKCTITGCAFISSGKLVLADHNNCRIKLVDVERKNIFKDKELDSRPWDVTVLPADLIAVTMPEHGVVMTITSNLETKHSFKVTGYCYGIAYSQGRLYIVCQNPKVVLISNLKGNVKHLIPLTDIKLFCSPKYILLSQNDRLLYISDCDSNTVVAITLQGQIFKVYKEKDLNGPQGMARLDDGSLLVACQSYNTIHHVSGNLKERFGIINSRNLPQSVCYAPSRTELYVGKWRCDYLDILCLQHSGLL